MEIAHVPFLLIILDGVAIFRVRGNPPLIVFIDAASRPVEKYTAGMRPTHFWMFAFTIAQYPH